jgi:hypothetical protein
MFVEGVTMAHTVREGPVEKVPLPVELRPGVTFAVHDPFRQELSLI